MGIGLLVVFFVLQLLGEDPGSAPTEAPEPRTFLRNYLNFSEADLAAMEHGRVMVKGLKTEKHEVAAFGIVIVRAPRQFFLSEFRDIEGYKKSLAVPQVKKFSNPPRLADVEELVLDPQDVEAIKRCKPGNCEFKLPAALIERFRKQVNWSAPDHAAKATSMARQMLVDYVQTYLAGGNETLAEYQDKKDAVHIADEFHQLLRQSPYLYEYVPELLEYLQNFPDSHLDNAQNFIYWSKERYGLKPVVTVTHVTIYQRPRELDGPIWIASKQIYASHYFEASLGLTALVEASQDRAGPGFYLMYLNRSRADALRGRFGRLARGTVERRMRGAMRQNMELTKRRIEALYLAEHSQAGPVP